MVEYDHWSLADDDAHMLGDFCVASRDTVDQWIPQLSECESILGCQPSSGIQSATEILPPPWSRVLRGMVTRPLIAGKSGKLSIQFGLLFTR